MTDNTADINVTDIEESNEAEAEANVTVEDSSEQDTSIDNTKEKNKFLRLPLTRVKNIMKFDTDCTLVSQEAVVLVAKATELFVDMLSKEMFKYTLASKRKTVMKRDLMTAIETSDNLCFLEGMLD